MPLPGHNIHCFCIPCREHHKRTGEPMTEFCAICEKPTPYLKSTHINERENYLKDIGQLCEICAKRNRSCGI
ncbi:MAG: hypothetical protein HYT67_02305 [Candidatus Yanofskybacteria bacterium]|nr:hypothetical protein [Candidatus Yanofskybacteria bacterium]